MMTCCPDPNGGAVSPIRARDAEGASAGFGGDSRRACAPARGGNPLGITTPPADMDTTGSDNEPATENTSFWDSIQQSPYFQIEAGFYSGFILGMVPFGGVIEEGCEAVEPSTREARFGRGVGLMLAGIYTAFTGANGEVLGGLTTATGVGATIGVPAMAVSTTLVIGGFTNAGIGFRETMNSLMSSEDSGAGTGSGAGPPAAKGGTYKLKDPETGAVRRTGRTNDLARREGEHGRAPETRDLDFEVDKRTDSYAAQRGREQRIWEQHPEADLNRKQPIDPKNPWREEYLREGDKL